LKPTNRFKRSSGKMREVFKVDQWAFNLALSVKRDEVQLTHYLWNLDRERGAFHRSGNLEEAHILALKIHHLRPYALGINHV